VELAMRARHLGKAISNPRFSGQRRSGGIPHRRRAGNRHDEALALMGAISRALWEEERDIADAATLAAIASECGLPAGQLVSRAAEPDIAARYGTLTQEAIARGVFGAPNVRRCRRALLGAGSARLL
jgi:2-hydroxychromene-2-carboxylate isomerase